LQILAAAQKIKVYELRFGLRQQLLIDLEPYHLPEFTADMDRMSINYQVDDIRYPNIISSYPAEDVFIRDTWISEGVYKDVLESYAYEPELKINICDSNQSITPMLTGNINWVASDHPHYWHLFVRFPKTNTVAEWEQLTYTNDLAKVSEKVERIILADKQKFVDHPEVDSAALFNLMDLPDVHTKPSEHPARLPQFNLPYYEGLNRYENKYWLGIYRRDEMFSVDFLQRVCQLCLDTRLGQFCCTSWKTIMIKGIQEKDKEHWNLLLEAFQINMRHAANELNFQVEDHSPEGLALKNYLVQHLSIDDTRTFGVCFGIKTRPKSEVFSSILVRRRYMIDFWGIRLGKVYDILCSKDFNPNERTEEVFSSGNPKIVLAEQLRRAVVKFYKYRAGLHKKALKQKTITIQPESKTAAEMVFQCGKCLTIYDPAVGEPAAGISAGTSFKQLPASFQCSVCAAGVDAFKEVSRSTLGM
jgi:rubredoxin